MIQAINFSVPEAIAAGIVLFVASYVRGVTGFGFSAVLVAGLAFIVDPARALPIAFGYEVIASMVQARSVWLEIRWRTLLILSAAAFVGNPIGLTILATVDPGVLRAVVYGALLVLTIGLLRPRVGHVEPTPSVLLAVGLIAGVINGATALSGLVLVLALTYMTITALELRATLVAYFFVSNLFAVGALASTNNIESADGWRVVVGVPVLVVGVALGSRTFRGMQPATFRRLTIWLLLALSLVGILRLAAGLFE